MDLRDAAIQVSEASKAAEAAALTAKRNLDRINARARVRVVFHDLLGIDVPDVDVIERRRHDYEPHDGSPGVIVDGHRLALCVTTCRYGPKPRRDVLHPYYVHDNGTFHYLDSLHDITTMAGLGRLLSAPRLKFAGRDPLWVDKEVHSYAPGVGVVCHWRAGHEADEVIGGTTPLT